MDYRKELFKALTTGIEGTMRDKHIDALVEVCKAARKEGYSAGLKDGNISDGTLEEKIKESYENRTNEAWELARDLTFSAKYDCLTREEIFGYTDVENILKLTGVQALADLKEYEEKQKEPTFKIGDRVRTLIDKDSLGVELFPVGTIGEVTAVGIEGNTIEVSVDKKKWYYHQEEIELANDVIIVGDEVVNKYGWKRVVTNTHIDGEVTLMDSNGDSYVYSRAEASDLDLKKTGRHFPQIPEVLKQMQEVEA